LESFHDWLAVFLVEAQPWLRSQIQLFGLPVISKNLGQAFQNLLWAAAWTCSWRAGLKMLPLAVPPKPKWRQGFRPVGGGEDCWVYGASI
jgi:hypothetical protein